MDNFSKDSFKGIIDKFKKLNYSDPVVLITLSLIVTLPWTAGYLIRMGLALGLMQTLGILLIYKKLPLPVKLWCEEHPLLADAMLDGVATATMAGVFDGGVTLAISATVTGLLLSWAIPAIEKLEHEQRKSTSSSSL